MDNQQGGTNPQGGDNNPQGSGNSPQGGDNNPQGGDNAQGNNYEYGQNMGGSQPYYNPYLQNQQNQQPPQGQVSQEQVPQSQSPQSPVPQNQPQPNPYLNQQTPPTGPQVPPQPTQPPQQPRGAPSGYAPQQGQQPQQPPAQPGGPQYYQYPQNDYGAGYPNQPVAGHMAGQPMPRKKSNAGAIVVGRWHNRINRAHLPLVPRAANLTAHAGAVHAHAQSNHRPNPWRHPAYRYCR